MATKVRVKVTLTDENDAVLDRFVVVGNPGTPDDVHLQRAIRDILEDIYEEVEEVE